MGSSNISRKIVVRTCELRYSCLEEDATNFVMFSNFFFRETTITTRNMILQQGWPHFAEDKTCLCHQSDFWQKIRHKLKQYAKKCGECISRFLSS